MLSVWNNKCIGVTPLNFSDILLSDRSPDVSTNNELVTEKQIIWYRIKIIFNWLHRPFIHWKCIEAGVHPINCVHSYGL